MNPLRMCFDGGKGNRPLVPRFFLRISFDNDMPVFSAP